jgi:hypothetical protein
MSTQAEPLPAGVPSLAAEGESPPKTIVSQAAAS